MDTIEEQVATVIGKLAWINIKFSMQKSSGEERVRIYGRKEARRGSFLGNEASPTRVAIIFALLYATSTFPSRIHLGPLSSVHYLLPSSLSFSRVSVCASIERFVTRATGRPTRPTRETHGNSAIFPSTISIYSYSRLLRPLLCRSPGGSPRYALFGDVGTRRLTTYRPTIELDRSNYTLHDYSFGQVVKLRFRPRYFNSSELSKLRLGILIFAANISN